MGGGGRRRHGDDTVEVAGVKLARRKVADLDKDALRGLADSLKAQDQERRRRHRVGERRQGADRRRGDAGPDRHASRPAQIVKEIAPIVGGGGGGRPDFAEAGGKQPEKIDEMLAAAPAAIQSMLE